MDDHQPASSASSEPSVTTGSRGASLVDSLDTQLLQARVLRELVGDASEEVRVGRFVLEHELGSGGMGTVYAGLDPQLGRRVALKFLRRLGDGALAEQRLLREARALAQLAHPNVVAIYDFGRYRGRVWLAMEFVPGRTLRTWANQAPRRRTELLDAWLAAGRGLAAVHAAGLIHRDIKPDNVMLGDDGRVRIVDFGLVRAIDHAPKSISNSDHETLDELGGSLTARGFVGTPAYAAPEQLDGSADARSDQYSFCVSVWEALCGERPPRLPDGQLDFSARKKLPRRLAGTLIKGMALDARDRFVDMPALLASLAPVRRRGLLLAAGLVTAAALGFGASVALRQANEGPPPADVCAEVGAPIDALWTPARERLLDRLPGSRSIAVLDRWAEDWHSAARQACEDLHLRSLRSAASLDRRGVCLDRRLAELAALVAAAERGRITAEHELVEWLAQLGDPQACLDEITLGRGVAAVSPEQTEAIAELRRELVAVNLGNVERSVSERLAAAERLHARARELGWRPLIGEAALALGHVHVLAGDATAARERLGEALDVAELEDDIELAAKVWSELNRIERTLEFDIERAEWTWQRQAAVFTDVAAQPRQRARLLSDLGQVHELAARRPAAEQSLREALRLYEVIGPTAAWDHAATLRRLGNLIMDTGRPEQALDLFARAQALESGSDARALDQQRAELDATTMLDEGLALFFAGEHEQAITRLEQALARANHELGPRSELAARIHVSFAAIHAALGQTPRVREHAEQADAISFAVLGPTHPFRTDVLSAVGTAAYLEGRTEVARNAYQQALVVVRRVKPEHSIEVAEAELNLAFVLAELGDRSGAQDLIDHCLPILERELSADDPKLAMARELRP